MGYSSRNRKIDAFYSSILNKRQAGIENERVAIRKASRRNKALSIARSNIAKYNKDRGFKGIALNTFRGLPRATVKIAKNDWRENAKGVASGLWSGVKPLVKTAEYASPYLLMNSKARGKTNKWLDLFEKKIQPKGKVGKSVKSGFNFASIMIPYSASEKAIGAVSKLPSIAKYANLLGKGEKAVKRGKLLKDFASWELGGQAVTDKHGFKGRAKQAGEDAIAFGALAGTGKILSKLLSKGLSTTDKAVSKSMLNIARKKTMNLTARESNELGKQSIDVLRDNVIGGLKKKLTKLENYHPSSPNSFELLQKELERTRGVLNSAMKNKEPVKDLQDTYQQLIMEKHIPLKSAIQDFAGIVEGHKSGIDNNKDVDLTEIGKTLSEKLGLKDRMKRGKTSSGKALGTYFGDERQIRVKGAGDLRTVSHEIGHDLESKINIKPFNEELSKLDYDKGKLRPSEGFAEFVSKYVASPNEIKGTKFYKYFEDEIPAKYKEALLEARDKYKSFTSMSRAEQAGSFVGKFGEKAKSDLTLFEKMQDKFNKTYTGLFDRHNPINRLLGKDTYEQFRSQQGKDYNAYSFMNEKPVSFKGAKLVDGKIVPIIPKGKSLKEIMSAVGEEDAQKFGTYYHALHSLHDMKTQPMSVFRKSKEIVKELENDKFKKTAKELSQYNQNVLNYAHDSGIISDRLYNEWSKNKFFTSRFKIVEKEGKSLRPSGNAIKKRGDVEIEQKLVHPFEDSMINTQMLVTSANRNAVLQKVYKTVEANKSDLSPIIRFVKPNVKAVKMSEDEVRKVLSENGISIQNKDVADLVASTLFRKGNKANNVIPVFIKGKEKYMEVNDKALFDAIQGSEWTIGKLFPTMTKGLGKPADWLRAGATLTPAFMVKNISRDALSALVYSKNRQFVPFSNLFKGIKHLAGADGGGMKDLYNVSGGRLSTLVSLNRDEMVNEMKKALGTRSTAKKILSAPKEGLEFVSGGLERGTRIGEFARALENLTPKVVEGKMTAKEALEKAGFQSREITLDFGRQGKWVEQLALNKITAFLNAGLQGTDKMMRELSHPSTWIKSAGYITAPSVLLWALNKDNPDYQKQESWKKDLFWSIPTGNKQTPFITIPKPFELGIIFGSVPERMLDYLYTKDKNIPKKILTAVQTGMTPNLMPTILTPLYEAKTNKSLFFNSQIIPQSKLDAPAELQYKSTTPELLKSIGAKIGMSPAMIEQTLYDYTGSAGKMAVNAVDNKFAKMTNKPVAPAKYPSSIGAGMKTLRSLGLATGEPIGNRDQRVQDFYDTMKKATSSYKGVKAGINTEDNELVKKYIGGAVDYKNLNKIRVYLAKINSFKNKIVSNKDLSAQEKRRELDNLSRVQSLLINNLQKTK